MRDWSIFHKIDKESECYICNAPEKLGVISSINVKITPEHITLQIAAIADAKESSEKSLEHFLSQSGFKHHYALVEDSPKLWKSAQVLFHSTEVDVCTVLSALAEKNFLEGDIVGYLTARVNLPLLKAQPLVDAKLESAQIEQYSPEYDQRFRSH